MEQLLKQFAHPVVQRCAELKDAGGVGLPQRVEYSGMVAPVGMKHQRVMAVGVDGHRHVLFRQKHERLDGRDVVAAPGEVFQKPLKLSCLTPSGHQGAGDGVDHLVLARL